MAFNKNYQTINRTKRIIIDRKSGQKNRKYNTRTKQQSSRFKKVDEFL